MQQLFKSVYRYAVPLEAREKLRVLRRHKHFQNLKRTEINGYTLKYFDEYGCIFVHIPKTGGVSVAKSLFGGMAGPHLTFRQYQYIYPPQLLDSYFKFTFVRNPWDRLVSAYIFLKEGGITPRDREWSSHHMDIYNNFDEFVSKWINEKNIYSQLHFIPQHEFICGKGLQVGVDFVGRFESMKDDFDFIQDRLGIQASLLHLNSSQRSEYREYYTNKSRQIVADIYHSDIKLFGYDF